MSEFESVITRGATPLAEERRERAVLVGVDRPGLSWPLASSLAELERLVDTAGADVVALDATDRPRPDGRTFEETVRALRAQCDTLIMADCMTIEDIRRGVACGCDLVSTTLSHNKAAIDTTMNDGPDIPILRQALEEFPGFPVICEGHVHTPADAKLVMDEGAWAVVVGTGITHPTSLTSWFKAAIEE